MPSKCVPKTPYEKWFGKKPSLGHIKIWGCPAYVKRQDADKLDARSVKCRFIGYPKETMGYYFYHMDEQKVFVARSATFLEREYALDGKGGHETELKELSNELEINIELNEIPDP